MPRERVLFAVACAVALAPLVAIAEPQAGVAAAVRGQVALARAQVPARPVVSREEIFMQDRLESGPRSGMQLMLLDETTFTIGPDSALVVDEFVYDPATGAGRVSAKIAKGVFRFVTGRVARQDPSNLNVGLVSGNIGVRGTIAAGRTDPATGESLVVLLGEGRDNASGDPAGEIEVCNAGACTEVRRAGYGVRIAGFQDQPGASFLVPTDDLQSLLRSLQDPTGMLADQEPGSADEDVEPSDVAGPGGDDRAREMRKHLSRIDDLDRLTDFAAQDGRDQNEIRIAELLKQNGVIGVADGPTTFDQLRGIPSGQIYYSANPVLTTGGDSYSFLLNIDLGAQTYAGGGSFLSLAGTRNGSASFPTPVSYAGASGNSTFQLNSGAFGAGCGSFCSVTLDVNPQNAGGVVAAQAQHNLMVRDSVNAVIDTGSGTSNAQPGFVP